MQYKVLCFCERRQGTLGLVADEAPDLFFSSFPGLSFVASPQVDALARRNTKNNGTTIGTWGCCGVSRE